MFGAAVQYHYLTFAYTFNPQFIRPDTTFLSEAKRKEAELDRRVEARKWGVSE